MTNRSSTLGRAISAALISCGVLFPRIDLLAASLKKGYGAYQNPSETNVLADSQVSWFYSWQPALNGIVPPAGVQFIPMIWGPQNLNATDENAAKATGAGTLLTFNEPNVPAQSSMTVQQALDAWPQLQALKMRLGSPAPGTGDDTNPNGWLAQFMVGAKARGYRVDFICIHPYQSNFDPAQATQNLINEVITVHNMYNLPIWVTEYAQANWSSSSQSPDEASQARFASMSANALETLPFVERYAWFTTVPNVPSFSAYNYDGSETAVGAAYKAAPTLGGTASDGTSGAWFDLHSVSNPGLCLEAQTFGTANGTEIVVNPCKGGSGWDQHWQFQPTRNSFYQLVPRWALSQGASRVMDLQGRGVVPGTPLQIWQPYGIITQQFDPYYLGSGKVSLRARKSFQCPATPPPNTPGQQLQTITCGRSASQQFQLTPEQ